MAEKCPYCNTKVKESEQQVRCPDCGTLYHYGCWKYFTEKCAICDLENEDYKEAKRKAEERKNEELERVRQQIKKIEQAHQEADAMRLAQEQARQKAEQERYQARINHLKSLGKEGYFEYKVISIVDKKGAVDVYALMATLNDLGLDGWELKCAYSNEMGKNSLEIAGFGLNSTADQNILILQRFVKFE